MEFNKSDITLNRVQAYFKDIDINEVFNIRPDKFVFRHTDCPYVFITDGQNLYAQDQDEIGIDPVSKYGLDNIIHIYNNFQEFIDTCKHIEESIGRELFLADYSGGAVLKCSIRYLELQYIKSKVAILKNRSTDELSNA